MNKKTPATYLKYDEENQQWVKLYNKMTKKQLAEELRIKDLNEQERRERHAETIEHLNKVRWAKEKESNRQIKALSGVVHVMAALKDQELPKEAVKLLVNMAIQALDDFKYGYDDDDDGDDDPFNDIGQLKDDEPF